MSIQKYEAFLKTVEYGSFTKAARALNYTQSGISHMLSGLEQEFGVTLLSRDRSGIQITSEGEKLLPYFRAVCDTQRELEAQVSDILGLESGLVRIGTFTSVSEHWMPYMIKEYLTSHPGIEFELLYGDYDQIEEWVAKGRVDFGFIGLPGRRNLQSAALARDEMVVILPPGHPLSHCETFPSDRLGDFPYVYLDEGSDYEIDSVFDTLGIYPNVQFTVRDDHTLITMTACGLGISIIPELVLRDMSCRVVAKKLDKPVWRTIGAVYRDSAAMSAAAGNFLGSVKLWAEALYGPVETGAES